MCSITARHTPQLKFVLHFSHAASVDEEESKKEKASITGDKGNPYHSAELDKGTKYILVLCIQSGLLSICNV